MNEEEQSRISFVENLASEFPDIKAIVDEEKDDLEPGEELPTFNVMASVARWVAETVEVSPENVASVLSALEHKFRVSDSATQTLIAIGFVESLPRSFERVGPLVEPYLGEYLRRLARINENGGGIFDVELQQVIDSIPGS